MKAECGLVETFMEALRKQDVMWAVDKPRCIVAHEQFYEAANEMQDGSLMVYTAARGRGKSICPKELRDSIEAGKRPIIFVRPRK